MNRLYWTALVLFFFHVISCQKHNHHHETSAYDARVPPDSNTVNMIHLTQRSYERIDFAKVNYAFNRKKADLLQSKLESMTPGSEMNVVLYDFADELLRSGRVDEAIVIFDDFLQFFEQRDFINKLETIAEIKRKLGVAYLRKAEIENCVNDHNAESCLIPISAQAQYKITEPTLTAIGYFEDFLESFPLDYEIQYLLNIAYMTIGQYPDQVPEQFLIPESYFQQDDFPRFRNIAGEVGVDKVGLSGGVCIDDFNHDGHLDLVVSSWDHNSQIVYFENDMHGSFHDMTSFTGLVGVTGGLNLKHADYNNDGYVDFIILRGAWFDEFGRIPNSLIRNNGDGTFSDVTVEAGLYSEFPTQTAAWADFNLDGWLDLFIANESSGLDDFYCELFINNRDGTFTETARSAGFNELGYFKGVTAGDVNNDGFPDIYLSDFRGENRLYMNAGDPTNISFDLVTEDAGVKAPEQSFSTWMFDYDNDGWEDIFVSSYSSGKITPVNMLMANLHGEFTQRRPKLYRNKGNGTFEDVSYQMGLRQPETTMGCNYGDLDNDGFPDFYLATGDPSFISIVPNKMYLNKSGQNFQDITFSGGFGHIQKGHAVGFGDLDLDGDQDVYVVMGGAYEGDYFQNALFQNPGNDNHWIQIRLQGTKSNRSAIGARIILKNTDSGNLQICHTVGTGASFGGNSLWAEIGLGHWNEIEEIKIEWPILGGDTTILTDIQANQIITVVEGEAGYHKLEL